METAPPHLETSFRAPNRSASFCTLLRAANWLFLRKPVDDGALLAAVAQAEQLDAELRRKSTELSSIEERLSSLSRRELEVLGHVVAGRKNKQIASDLGTVEQTIKVHRAHVMEKMRVQSVAELVRLVERCRIDGPVH